MSLTFFMQKMKIPPPPKDNNIGLVKDDYKNFLQSVPEHNRIYLEFVADRVEHVITDDPQTIFAYDGKLDEIQYNPNHPQFDSYDFRVADTHELAHKIDKYFVRSIKQTGFASAVQNGRKILDGDPDFFIRYCAENDTQGILSDIMSGIYSGKYEFPTGHPASYWTENKQIMECFANIFTLQSIEDLKSIQFLNKYFPELLHEFNRLNFSI